MKKIFIDSNWNFEQAVYNIRQIKNQVRNLCDSFTVFENKEKGEFQRQLRKDIYNLNLLDWQIERLLEYIYNDIDDEVLENLIKNNSKKNQ